MVHLDSWKPHSCVLDTLSRIDRSRLDLVTSRISDLLYLE